jgi:tryptophan-rich sensory protein
MSRALVYSLGLCALSVALEGLFAGSGIKRRLAELRVPRFAPPLAGWILIGLCYYVICFSLLYRLFSVPTAGSLQQRVPLALLGGVMLTNAFWNYFFFRTRNLLHAFLIGIPYSVLAVVLFGLLLKSDRTAAWVLFPYLVYLFYANYFGYRIWKLNV